MLAVHSHQMRLARFSSESCSRRGCTSITSYTLAVSPQSTQKCGLKKKLLKIKGESLMRYKTLLTRTSQSAKKERINEARQERPRLYESIRGEASVSIYIFAVALSRTLSMRVYSQPYNGKICSPWGSTLPKIRHYIEKSFK